MAEQMVFDADQVTAEVAEGIEKIQNASNLEELKAIKTTYAGADSAMTKASKAIGSLPVDQKKEAGKRQNEVLTRLDGTRPNRIVEGGAENADHGCIGTSHCALRRTKLAQRLPKWQGTEHQQQSG